MTAPSQTHSVDSPVTDVDIDTAGTETRGEPPRPRLPSPRPGSVVGRYVIRERIGVGGMGEVFAAHDPELDRAIALKLIHADRGERLAHDDVTQRECERLRTEAQALARLSHPNVVQVYEVGRHEPGGRMFLAMELVDGPTLSKWRPGSMAELLDAYAQAGRGLAAAHWAGLAHRDFKPGNVLVGRDGRVRVVDFGLATPARAVEERASTIGDESDEPRQHTSASNLAGPGTLPYMAPEQAFAGAGGPAADQFSFCVALFEAVYGARPFPAVAVMELLLKLESCTIAFPVEPPPLGRVPRWLRQLLQRGLSRRPEQRYPSMDALLAELTRDRLRPWRRIGFAAVVSGVTAVALLLASAPTEVEPLPEPDLDGVWDGERREQLERAFNRVDTAWASGSEAAVLAGLDHWSVRWIEAARGARDTRDPLARRTIEACLDSQRAHADFTIATLIESEPELLEGAVAAVDALPEPSRCSSGDTNGFAWIEPRAITNPDVLRPELRSLADAAAQRGLGNFELARTGADLVLREAMSHGWTAVEIAALRQRGLATIETGDRTSGLADLARARTLAVRSGDRQTEVELWVDLAWAGRKLDDVALRRDWLALAAAHVEASLSSHASHAASTESVDRHTALLAARVSLAQALDLLDPSAPAELDASSGSSDPLEQAEQLLITGLERLESIEAGDSRLAIDYLHALARVHDRAGMRELAEQDFQRAIARAERVRGPDHPTNARLWFDAGALAHARGQLGLARERMLRARNIRRAALRVDHPELARSELGLAQLEFSSHNDAAAKEHAERALHAIERSTGNRDSLPETLRLLGQLEAGEAHWETAVGYYERALALTSIPSLQRSLIELELGKSLGALGQDVRAIELLDSSLPIVAARLGERCDELITAYERRANSAARLGHQDSAIADFEAALACTDDPTTRAQLDVQLQSLH